MSGCDNEEVNEIGTEKGKQKKRRTNCGKVILLARGIYFLNGKKLFKEGAAKFWYQGRVHEIEE